MFVIVKTYKVSILYKLKHKLNSVKTAINFFMEYYKIILKVFRKIKLRITKPILNKK